MIIKLTNEKLHLRVGTQAHRQKNGSCREIGWSPDRMVKWRLELSLLPYACQTFFRCVCLLRIFLIVKQQIKGDWV